jgi:hypothetical protein
MDFRGFFGAAIGLPRCSGEPCVHLDFPWQRTADLAQLHPVVPANENKGGCCDPRCQVGSAGVFSFVPNVGLLGSGHCTRVPGNTGWMVAQSAFLGDQIFQTAFQWMRQEVSQWKLESACYRRLLLRFLLQLGALFVLTSICFYISILAWSRVSESVFFSQSTVSSMSVAFYQIDLMLRGALFDFMEHTRQSISPIAVNRSAVAFLYYTLMFRMFVAIHVMSSVFRVLRFVLRRWRVLLR